MSTAKRVAYFLGLPILLVVMWWALTLGPVNFYVPTPQKLGETFVKVWGGERFRTDFLPSVIRLFIGLVATIVLGIVFGVLIGSFRWLRSLTEPVLEFFRAIPPPVLVPLFMLLMGPTDQMRIAVIVSGAIWPVLLNTVEGVRAVDEVLMNTSRTYRIDGFARLRYLVLPAATAADHDRHPPEPVDRTDPHGHLRDVRRVVGARLHDRVVPARVRDPGDVERHRRSRLDRHCPLPDIEGSRGQGTALVPRTERGAT